MYKPIIIVWLFSLMGNILLAQNPVLDSNKVSLAENNAVGLFNKGIGKQSRLYNGAEYIPYELYIKSNAYFNDADLNLATVKFDGYTYTNVPAKYDLFKNVLIAKFPDDGPLYVLAPERVSGFILMGHRFKYISADTVNISSGFYDQLYLGKASALAKYAKTLQSSIENGIVNKYFTKVKTEYFIERGSDILAFDSQGSLLSLLKDHKKQLQQYIKTNNIKYKKQPEQAIVQIVSYYNQLIN